MLTADALAENGLQLAELMPDVLAAVDELLPPFWSRGNPIDLVATVVHGVPERVIEFVASSDAVDAVIPLALIGSPRSGRAEQEWSPGAGGTLAELNDRETALLLHVATVMERTGKPIVSVPLCPVQRSVFPGLGRYAPVLLPSFPRRSAPWPAPPGMRPTTSAEVPAPITLRQVRLQHRRTEARHPVWARDEHSGGGGRAGRVAEGLRGGFARAPSRSGGAIALATG